MIMWHQHQTNLLVSIESMSEADRRVAEAEWARMVHAFAELLRWWRSRIAALVVRDTAPACAQPEVTR
jgi:hypothetical protein